jgi:hypothetical protein
MAAPATADVAPPWCGTAETDAAANLPDGSDPGDPLGSFAHIPYYAIRCTLEDIVAASQGRMTLEVIGQSALGRDLFLVTVNAPTLQVLWRRLRGKDPDGYLLKRRAA